MTLTLEYAESDLREENLALAFWDPDTTVWIEATKSCTPTGTVERNTVDNILVVTTCRLGKYALVEVQSVSYLPVVNQDSYLP
jgi:hypothetical protein